MNLDFTCQAYAELVKTLASAGYACTTYLDYILHPEDFGKVAILRHDVDNRPQNAMAFALIESDIGVRSSYYFRAVPKSYDKEVVCRIEALGHEIGYHYEDLSLVGGDRSAAIGLFKKNLELFRTVSEVKTICMHGSPLSKWDNREMWQGYDYREFGIIGEPYLDIDYNEVFYLTDTGRKWNNIHSSVRDKVSSRFNLTFDSTFQVIDKIQRSQFPDKAMINTHPQRWSDNIADWSMELIAQNAKNVIKRFLV